MCPSIRRTNAVGIAATVNNVLEGSEFEFLPRAARIQVYQVASAGDLQTDVSFGNTIQTQASAIPLEPAAGQGPNINEHKIVDDVADTGQTLRLVQEFVAGKVGSARTAVLYEKSRSVIKSDYVWRRTDRWINFPWSSEAPIAEPQKASAVRDA